jgi:hypothetical protein
MRYFYWNVIQAEPVKFNPALYAMKHFSAALFPGARRVAVSGQPARTSCRISGSRWRQAAGLGQQNRSDYFRHSGH